MKGAFITRGGSLLTYDTHSVAFRLSATYPTGIRSETKVYSFFSGSPGCLAQRKLKLQNPPCFASPLYELNYVLGVSLPHHFSCPVHVSTLHAGN